MRRFLLMLSLTVMVSGAAPLANLSEHDGKLHARVERLIGQLGDDHFVARRAAEKKLLAVGHDAFDQLKAAENHPDPEIAARARHIARRITIGWVRPDDPEVVRQMMGNYGNMSENERLAVVNHLAALNNDKVFPVLCRIARFDQSAYISRSTALAIAKSPPEDADRLAKQREVLLERLGGSRRIAVKWLRTYVVQFDNPEAALPQWGEHIKEQKAAGGNVSRGEQLLIGLLRQKADLLERLGRENKSLDAWFEMIALDRNDAHGILNELIPRLIDAKRWDAVGLVVEKHGDAFARQPDLLYQLAGAYLEQGYPDKAEKLAEQAFSITGNSPQRLENGQSLAASGRFRWAEREYRSLIDNTPITVQESILARAWLAAQLYDGERHLEAASLYDDLIAGAKKDKGVRLMLGEYGTNLQARRDYFLACHAKKQNNRRTERKYLDQAAKHDPTDVDVVIAMYNLPDMDAAYRKNIRKRIEEAGKKLEKEIEGNPEMAVHYNNWSWLIANTEGDFDKAIHRAEKAVELADSNSLAGYLDTLARCHYAKGNVKNAIKFQKQALELDPHTRQLRRQLEMFEEK